MPSKAHFVHVPVDRVEICNGPGPVIWVKTVALLHANMFQEIPLPDIEVDDLEFTLRTSASSKTFRRKLKITSADVDIIDFGEVDVEVGFTAIFNRQIASGIYNPGRRTGWFSI
ncbi:MAG TPA: hypothetical protein VGE13_00800 [Candidatus Saccharimonadales bacterium]